VFGNGTLVVNGTDCMEHIQVPQVCTVPHSWQVIQFNSLFTLSN
jgi:hypothetical protein